MEVKWKVEEYEMLRNAPWVMATWGDFYKLIDYGSVLYSYSILSILKVIYI